MSQLGSLELAHNGLEASTSLELTDFKDERLPSPSASSPRIVTKSYVARWEHVRTAFQHLLRRARCFTYTKESIPLNLDASCELGKQHQLRLQWIFSFKDRSKSKSGEIEERDTAKNAWIPSTPFWKYTQEVTLVYFQKDRPTLVANFQCPLSDFLQSSSNVSITTTLSDDLLSLQAVSLFRGHFSGPVDMRSAPEPTSGLASQPTSESAAHQVRVIKSSHHQSPYCFASENYENVAPLTLVSWNVLNCIPPNTWSARQIWFQPAFHQQFGAIMELIHKSFDFFVGTKALSAVGEPLSAKETAKTDAVSGTGLPPIDHAYPTCLAIHCLPVTEDDHAAFYISPLTQENTTVTLKAQLDVYELKHVENFCFCVGFECFKDKPCVLTDLLLFSKESHECHNLIEQQLDEILHTHFPLKLADLKGDVGRMRRLQAEFTPSIPQRPSQSMGQDADFIKSQMVPLSPSLISPTASTSSTFRFPLPSAISTLSRKDEMAYAEYGHPKSGGIDLRGSAVTHTQSYPEEARFAPQHNVAMPASTAALQKSQSATYLPFDEARVDTRADKQNYFFTDSSKITPFADYESQKKPAYYRAFSSPALTSLALASAVSSATSALPSTLSPSAVEKTPSESQQDPLLFRGGNGQPLSEAPRRRLPSIF